ncbi:hypothetical protein NAT65_28990 [Achromobacter xylosoxidans]|uniref:hypothetical protein n=1 Tax=Alcaligenes xylosoxydans xylosoxydans TaxID=85698 RepID=UPI00203D088A|nr:hypothetical protein [Achromobacter xylosoxidans]MCM2575148.1 hypothetical protein [Achromobacter xylosoxidans]
MPRISTIQTNFTAGEISPKVRGRVDVARYQNGAEMLENMVVDVYGGAFRAPGTEYVAPVADHAVAGRLIQFAFNRSTAYHLEFGNLRMRVIRAGAGLVMSGGVPYEIVTPFTAAELPDVKYTQAADTMFLAHPNHPIQQLRRVADDSWLMGNAAFSVLPFSEVGDLLGSTLTLSSTGIGTGITASISAALFMPADVGRRITYQGGVALITAFTNSNNLVVQILSPFSSASLASGTWTLEESPQSTITPSSQGKVGQAITLTADIDTWRSTDVGKFVKVDGGLVQITVVPTAKTASGLVKADLTSAVAAGPGAWTLQGAAWGGANGYPSAVGVFQQRLIAGGNKKYPNGIWGSKTGLYLDFTQGSEDSDGYFYALDGESNGIDHVMSVRALIALTPGTEWTLVGGVEKPLTPTNVQARDQTVYGCSRVRPVRIGSELLFVQGAGRKVRAMGYNASSDAYVAPDLTMLAEHITKSGVREMAYQQEPNSTLWAVRQDGGMAALTINREEGVTAWTPQTTDGAYESVSCVPTATGNEVMVIVRRTINGQVRRYLERLNEAYLVHSGIIGHSEAGAATWGNLGHLEGKQVTALADGTPQGIFTVAGGEITLPRNANDVQIGLPVTPRVRLLRPEVGTPTGTAQGSNMRAHRYSLLFLKTVGATVNGKYVAFRKFGSHLLDRPPEPYDGWKEIGEYGWDVGEMPTEISQPDPLPFHILAVVRHWTTNE